MEVPQVWTQVPNGAEPLRKEVLPQRNAPGPCDRTTVILYIISYIQIRLLWPVKTF